MPSDTPNEITEMFRAHGRRSLRAGIMIGFGAAVSCYFILVLVTH